MSPVAAWLRGPGRFPAAERGEIRAIPFPGKDEPASMEGKLLSNLGNFIIGRPRGHFQPGEQYEKTWPVTQQFRYRIFCKIVPSLKERDRLESLACPKGRWGHLQDYFLTMLKEYGLRPGHTLLDIGCGPISAGLVLIPYLDRGGYYGFDIRPKSLNEAYRLVAKLGCAGKNPRIFYSETFGRDELGNLQFDYFLAHSVLYHLDEDKLEACLQEISRRMKPHSKFYGDTINKTDIPAVVGRWAEFTYYSRPREYYERMGEKYGLRMNFIGPFDHPGFPFKENNLIEYTKAAAS